jgi:hypothetical protein
LSIFVPQKKSEGERIYVDVGGINIIDSYPLKVSQKRMLSWRKNISLIPLLPYFFHQYTVCESGTIIAWSKRKKNKDTRRKEYHIFSPVRYLSFFSVTIKTIILGFRGKK